MIQHIDVGFLTGNLWEGASAQEYECALREALYRSYPGVDITITRETGSGSPPLSTQTRVYDVSGNRMENEEQSVNLLISNLDTEICENPSHPVWDNSHASTSLNYQDDTLVLEFIHMPDEGHEVPVASIMVGSQGVATYRFDPNDDYTDMPESCPVCGMDYEYAFIDFRTKRK